MPPDRSYDPTMSEPPSPPAAEALQLFIDAVEQIPAGGLDRPSNLPDWNLADLVAHATGSAAKLLALIEDRPVKPGPSAPADWRCADPLGRLRELAAALAAALPGADLGAPRTTPHGEVPLRRALALPVADLAIHSWDVHRSLGRSVELPAGPLTFCRTLVESVPDEALRRPGAFGPARPAPAAATPTTALMAYLGRTVDGDTPGGSAPSTGMGESSS